MIIASLAARFAETVREASRIAGQEVRVVHLVGGGAHNALLCQLLADALDLPVWAGPTEATAWGNVLVQARALGTVSGGLTSLREVLVRACAPRRFEPRSTSV